MILILYVISKTFMILILYVILKYKIMTSVVPFAFQNTFQFEMHQNIVFFIFLKKLFLKSTYQNDPKHIKKINFS
jgi:hypothetical protein